MKNLRQRYTSEFKAKVSREAFREEKSSRELSSEFQVHPCMIRRWKQEAWEGLIEFFSQKKNGGDKEKEKRIKKLYKQIEEQKAEINWLKSKILALPVMTRKRLVELTDSHISISRQAELLGIARSTIYYPTTVNPQNPQMNFGDTRLNA